jgi:hypothetical protein
LREGNFWREIRGGTAGAQPILARNSLPSKIIKSLILLEFKNFFRIIKCLGITNKMALSEIL